jgi:hypothetical protein
MEDCRARHRPPLLNRDDLGHRLLCRQPDFQIISQPPNSFGIVLWRSGVPANELRRTTFVGHSAKTGATAALSKNLRRTYHHVFCWSADRFYGATVRAIRITKKDERFSPARLFAFEAKLKLAERW